jgi:Glyoxalase-like domain
MRNLDHFVMPVADLASARMRFSALGFTVAPDARHPFGTENCCIFFADGTFIEPLAIGDPRLYDDAFQAGNVFVANDKRFRTTKQEGFSQLVIKSGDAAGDDTHYKRKGVSGGTLLDFVRQFTRTDGTEGEVAFRLAFAAPEAKANRNSIQTGFFACEVTKPVSGGRGALVDHANGAKASIAVIATAAEPLATDGFFELFLGSQSTADIDVSYPTNGGALRVVRPDMYRELTDVEPRKANAFSLAALVIGVKSVDDLRKIMRQNTIRHHEKADCLVVPPAAGQPVTLVFKSAK